MSKSSFKSEIEFVESSLTIDEVIDSKIEQHNAEASDDAFFVCDLGDVANKYKTWTLVYPRIKPFYAVKCNDDTPLLELLAMLGTGFDCASKAEIQKVQALGVDGSRIVYANPCKQASYIKYASKVGVDLMTFDNVNELRKVKAVFPEARLVLRMLPPATDKVQCILGNKFGCPPEGAEQLIQVARELDLNLVGVSFHVGSGCYDARAYRTAVEQARGVFDTAKGYGYNMTLLDVGGGFPGTDFAKITIHEIAVELNAALDELFPAGGGVEIISEPGRFFTASAYTLTTHVIAKRHVESAQGESIMYYVNDGVYGSFNCLLYDHADVEACVPASCKRQGQRQLNSSVWGPTCDGLDVIHKEILLPELQEGDWIYFKDMGSYTLAAGSTFNGIPRPRVYYIADLRSASGNDGTISAVDQFNLCLKSGHSVYNTIKPLPMHRIMLGVYN